MSLLRFAASSFGFILLCSSTIQAGPSTGLLQRRADQVPCAAGDQLAQTIREAVTNENCPQTSGFEFDTAKARITLTTDPAKDGVATEVEEQPPNSVCDQILDPAVLVSVLQAKGGFCDKLNQLGVTTEADQEPFLNPLISIINDPRNLVFVTDAAQSLKPALITTFLASDKPVPTAGVTSPIESLAAMDYLSKTQAQSNAIAATLDAALQTTLVDTDGNAIPVTGSVSTTWSGLLAFAKASSELTKTAASAKIQTLSGVVAETQRRSQKCGSAPPETPVAASNTSGETSASTRRLRRTFVPHARSVLKRRAFRSPRSGPQAPPAPSCPVGGVNPKTTIPVSQAVFKEPTGTFKVAQPESLGPKTGSTRRKPVPRPASRPGRTPGQAAVSRRRITPRKKPKIVPKPAGKEKGRSRGRARR